MKFKYYITDLFSGSIVGTNNDAYAESYATSEDYFVVDADAGEWLQQDGQRVPVEERSDE